MARPEKNRSVQLPPLFNRFKPAGIMNCDLLEVLLSLDEYEALRLADYDGLEHSEAAELMKISRPTFTRLISRARNKIAEFLVEGKALSIEGGAVHFRENIIHCLECGHRYRAKISGGKIKCPDCGSENCRDIAKSFGHGRCCRSFSSRIQDQENPKN